MVKRCAWGTCNADDRYPDRYPGVFFLAFSKTKTKMEKCLRWIRACGRPRDQLNPDKINKHQYVCSRHFVGDSGPSETFPDPIPADGGKAPPARCPPRRRKFLEKHGSPDKENDCPAIQPEVATQTDNSWVSTMDILAQSVEIHILKNQVKDQESRIEQLTCCVEEKNNLIQELTKNVHGLEGNGGSLLMKLTSGYS